jgi:hypothetical protein
MMEELDPNKSIAVQMQIKDGARIIRCYDAKGLYEWTARNPTDPTTRIKFDENQIKQIKAIYEKAYPPPPGQPLVFKQFVVKPLLLFDSNDTRDAYVISTPSVPNTWLIYRFNGTAYAFELITPHIQTNWTSLIDNSTITASNIMKEMLITAMKDAIATNIGGKIKTLLRSFLKIQIGGKRRASAKPKAPPPAKANASVKPKATVKPKVPVKPKATVKPKVPVKPKATVKPPTKRN